MTPHQARPGPAPGQLSIKSQECKTQRRLPALQMCQLNIWSHMKEIYENVLQDSSGGNLNNLPMYKENKDATLNTISFHTVGDIDMKPSRGDRPRSNLGPEGCDQLPGVTSCQL